MPKDNPSWESIKLLEKTIESGNKTFHVYASEIPVEYKAVEEIVPILHQEKPFDFVLHIGQGHNSIIEFETLARSGGYSKPDNKTQFPADHLAPQKYLTNSGNPDSLVLSPELDFKALREKVMARADFDKIRLSEDAGLYLCEYTYFCSLGEALDIKKKVQTDTRKVLFVHVPRPDDQITLVDISRVLKALIVSLPEV